MNIPKLITGAWNNVTFKFNHKRGKVLIINDGALGDYIHGLPFCYMFKNLGYDVSILTEDKNKIDNEFRIVDYVVLGKEVFDMIFVMNYKQPIQFALIGRNVFDFNFRRAKMKLLKKWKEIHWSDYYLECLSNWVKKSIFFDNGNRVESQKYVVFHPGSSDMRKNWNIGNFIEVYKNIDYPHKLFVLGPADKHLEVILKKNRCQYILSTDFTLLEALAKQTALFVGCDSGVGHYFSTFNCNVIILFSIGCATTHFPYTRNGTFYYEEDVFNKFFKTGEIIEIKLEPNTLLKQINHFTKKDNKIEPGFFKSADFCKYLI